MAVIEKDGVITTKDKDGNVSIIMPATTLENVGAKADIKDAPANEDYLPIIDSQDNQMKKVLAQTVIGDITADAEIDYTEAEELVPLTPREKLTIAMSKIAKAVSEVITHIGDNVRHITGVERSSWNSAKALADAMDKIAIADICSEEGVHGLRYFNDKLQVQDVSGNWVDAEAGDGNVEQHNADSTAHPAILARIEEVEDKVLAIEIAGGADVTANPFAVTFGTLDGTISDGIWDSGNMRLGF